MSTPGGANCRAGVNSSPSLGHTCTRASGRAPMPRMQSGVIQQPFLWLPGGRWMTVFCPVGFQDQPGFFTDCCVLFDRTGEGEGAGVGNPSVPSHLHAPVVLTQPGTSAVLGTASHSVCPRTGLWPTAQKLETRLPPLVELPRFVGAVSPARPCCPLEPRREPRSTDPTSLAFSFLEEIFKGLRMRQHQSRPVPQLITKAI